MVDAGRPAGPPSGQIGPADPAVTPEPPSMLTEIPEIPGPDPGPELVQEPEPGADAAADAELNPAPKGSPRPLSGSTSTSPWERYSVRFQATSPLKRWRTLGLFIVAPLLWFTAVGLATRLLGHGHIFYDTVVVTGASFILGWIFLLLGVWLKNHEREP